MEGQTVFSVTYELKPKNQRRPEHLAIYDNSTGNLVSRPLRDNCRRRDISCIVREVKATQTVLIQRCSIQRCSTLKLTHFGDNAFD